MLRLGLGFCCFVGFIFARVSLQILTADKACQQIEQGIAEGKISSPKPSETPEIVKHSRTHAIGIMQNYIHHSTEGKNIIDNKLPILGTSGMKGIGKTTVLKYGLAKVLPDLKMMKMPAKGAYLTFNGGSAESANVFWTSQTQQTTALDSVGHVLMANLKVEAQRYSLLDVEQCLNLFRKALGRFDAESLVLFVDEIGELKKQADDVLKALMFAADARKGKLVFVHAHISQQFLDHVATGSGRKSHFIAPRSVAHRHLEAEEGLEGRGSNACRHSATPSSVLAV